MKKKKDEIVSLKFKHLDGKEYWIDSGCGVLSVSVVTGEKPSQVLKRAKIITRGKRPNDKVGLYQHEIYCLLGMDNWVHYEDINCCVHTYIQFNPTCLLLIKDGKEFHAVGVKNGVIHDTYFAENLPYLKVHAAYTKIKGKKK